MFFGAGKTKLGLRTCQDEGSSSEESKISDETLKGYPIKKKKKDKLPYERLKQSLDSSKITGPSFICL